MNSMRCILDWYPADPVGLPVIPGPDIILSDINTKQQDVAVDEQAPCLPTNESCRNCEKQQLHALSLTWNISLIQYRRAQDHKNYLCKTEEMLPIRTEKGGRMLMVIEILDIVSIWYEPYKAL